MCTEVRSAGFTPQARAPAWQGPAPVSAHPQSQSGVYTPIPLQQLGAWRPCSVQGEMVSMCSCLQWSSSTYKQLPAYNWSGSFQLFECWNCVGKRCAMKRVSSLTIITLIISSLSLSFLKMSRQPLSQEKRETKSKRCPVKGILFCSLSCHERVHCSTSTVYCWLWRKEQITECRQRRRMVLSWDEQGFSLWQELAR